MEDTKLYSTQNIERLKQKIAVYRETLMTLKKGTSIEEFLNKKEEFDGFKVQITHLEGLSKTLEENQGIQFDGYGEKVKQIANQIDLLSQTVETMNQEISLLLKKEAHVEVDEHTDIPLNKSNIDPPSYVFNQALETHEEIPQVKEPFLLTNNSPSYMQLQKLAGLALSTKQDAYIEKPISSNPTPQKLPEARHFNQQYFQSINTHPSHMYNGLYKNILNTSSFHFKNESSIHEIPIHKDEPAVNSPVDLASEATVPIVDAVDSINTPAEENADSIAPIVETFETVDSTVEQVDLSAVPIVDEVNNIDKTAAKIENTVFPLSDEIVKINTVEKKSPPPSVPVVDEVDSIDSKVEEIDEVSIGSPIEKISVQAEINDLQDEPLIEEVPEENKKESFSSFFNLFRRKN